MLQNINIEKVLFLDIETVSQHPEFDSLEDDWKKLWSKKASFLTPQEGESPDLYNRAGIYAEFGKIICISLGYIKKENGQSLWKKVSVYGDDEKDLLKTVSTHLESFSQRGFSLCAHNGKEFDFPYMARRIVINQLPLPEVLRISGKKPWEVNLLDTMELWKFGDYKNYTSLNLLASVLGIPTPKDDIDGSMVNHVYWKENNLERIVTYCEKDVITVARILMRFKGEPIEDLIEETIISA